MNSNRNTKYHHLIFPVHITAPTSVLRTCRSGYTLLHSVLRVMGVCSRSKESRVVTHTADATFNTFAPGCTAVHWLSLRIPKVTSVRREYCIRSVYYRRYMTTLSVAKIAWLRCEINGISVRSTDRANPKYSDCHSVYHKPPMDCPGNELRPPRCETGDCLLEPPMDPVFYKLTRTPYSPVVTICTAQWSLYVPPV